MAEHGQPRGTGRGRMTTKLNSILNRRNPFSISILLPARCLTKHLWVLTMLPHLPSSLNLLAVADEDRHLHGTVNTNCRGLLLWVNLCLSLHVFLTAHIYAGQSCLIAHWMSEHFVQHIPVHTNYVHMVSTGLLSTEHIFTHIFIAAVSHTWFNHSYFMVNFNIWANTSFGFLARS